MGLELYRYFWIGFLEKVDFERFVRFCIDMKIG